MDVGTMAMRPWERDADKFARLACVEMTSGKSKGSMEDKVEYIHRSGRLSAFERVLGDVERNHTWTKDVIHDGTMVYLKKLNSTLAPLKLMARPRMFQAFKTTYLEGEILAVRKLLEDLKDSEKIVDRNDTMAELHFKIVDENNDIVRKYSRGKKITVSFFTDRYQKNPELFWA